MNFNTKDQKSDLIDKSDAISVGESVYQQLRENLLDNRYKPGSRLYSEELKEVYNCSISPLREALSRLSAEQLVSKIGQRGYRVAEISLEEMWDITNFRALVECEALRQSIEKGDRNWEERIVASFYGLSKPSAPSMAKDGLADWELRHRRFHHALLSACQSPWLLRTIELLQGHSERYRRLRLEMTEDISEGTQASTQHEKLMQAAIDYDIETAITLLRDHIKGTANFIQAHWQD